MTIDGRETSQLAVISPRLLVIFDSSTRPGFSLIKKKKKKKENKIMVSQSQASGSLAHRPLISCANRDTTVHSG